MPALPTALFGMFFVHPIPGILGRGWMDTTPWLLILAMLCQLICSLWLGRAISKKRGKGSLFVIVVTLLLMVGSLALGSLSAFAGCSAAEDAYLRPSPGAVKQLTSAETEALMRLRAAAEQGDVEAQWQLGCLHASGNGVPQDKTEAMRLFRKAAEQNHLGAINMLGLMFEHGDGIPKDEAEAARWFQQAADLGYYAAQLNLGEMCADGRGVPKDLVQASIWLKLSAEKGTKDAAISLQRIEQEMTPEQIQLATKRADELRTKIMENKPR